MMAATNEEDPFLQVQQDVLTQIQQTRPLFSSYLRIRSLSSASSSSNPELASARADLEAALASLAEDLADLDAAVAAAAADPAHYGLARTELARRQRLVRDVGAEIDDMREELAASGGGGGGGRSNTTTRTAAAREARRADSAALLPDPSAFSLGDEDGAGRRRRRRRGDGGGDDDDDDDDDDYAAEFEQQQQVAMMREQDDMLDATFATVGNIRRQADDMGRELEEQHEMLEHVDNLADRVQGRLATGMAKMSHIVRKNEDRWSGCCIGVLILVLVILLVLLLIL